MSYVCKDVTISGDVFYNDQRRYGRFPYHTDPSGAPGRQYKLVDADNGTSHGDNFLSLMDATVELYEVDLIDTTAVCEQATMVGTTTTDRYGHFTWTGQICDTCAQDDVLETGNAGNLGISVAAKVKLRYCASTGTERCFSVGQPPDYATGDVPNFDDHDLSLTTYSVWHTSANLTSPRKIFTATNVVMADAYFETTGTMTDLSLQAAMVHQGIAEATRRLHDDLGVPTRTDTFGEVKVVFPMRWDNHGAGHSHEQYGDDNANGLCLSAPGTGQTDGWIPTSWGDHDTEFHEYGHLVNYRAWDGYGKYVDYEFADCNAADGDCTGEQDNEEFVAAAFKENWADFMKRVVLNEVDAPDETLDELSCDNVAFDNDDSGATSICFLIPCAHGQRSPSAVEHTLCDFYDDRVDDNAAPSYAGADQQGIEELTGIIDDLEAAWTVGNQDAYFDASPTANRVRAGIGLCEIAAQRALRIPSKLGEIRDVLSLNGVDCDL